MEKNRFCRPSGCFCVPWAHRCHPCNPRITQGENEKAGGGFRFSVRGLTTLTAQRFGHLSGIQAEGNLTLASQASSLGLFLQWLITGVGALIGIGLIPSEGKVLNILVKKKKTTRKKACIILGGIHVPCWRFAYWLFAINPSGSFISLHFYSGIFMESQKVAKRVQRLPVDPPSSHPTGYISRNYSPLPKPGNWPGYCACVVLCHFMTCIDSWKCQPSRDADLLHHHP